MTKKKKVKFGETEEFSYNDDRNQTETMSSSTAKNSHSRRFKANHSLDSDEEFDDEKSNDKQDDVLKEDDIEGQEDETIRHEDGIIITPFNLREELEEGHFDAQGNYIANKADATDPWLESTDWDKIENQCHRAKKKQEDEEEDTKILPSHKIMQDMVSIMKPGENVLKCLRRLGGNKKPVSSADRWKKKKLLIEEPLDEKAMEDKENLLKLTGLADDLLQGGDFQIYEKTYEQLSYEIQSQLSQFDDAEDVKPFERPRKKPKLEDNQHEKKNIEPDEDDELEAAFNEPKIENDDPTKNIYLKEEIKVKSVFGISKDKVTEDEKTYKVVEEFPEISWIYKLSDDEKCEHLGPFTSTQMLNMQESGKFGEGVYCRKVGNEGNFYTSKRIDFDLYT